MGSRSTNNSLQTAPVYQMASGESGSSTSTSLTGTSLDERFAEIWNFMAQAIFNLYSFSSPFRHPVIVVGIFCRAVIGRTVGLVSFFFRSFFVFFLFSIKVGCCVQGLALLLFYSCGITSHSVSCPSPSVCGAPIERVAVYSGLGWAS